MYEAVTWLAVKAFFGGVWKFLRGLPWQVWAGAALLAAVWWYGHVRFEAGQADVQAKWNKAVADARDAAAKVKPKQDAVTERVVTKYVDRIQVVHERGATIVKEVPRYVPIDSCALPRGWRVLHDAAAENRLPDPAAVADAAAVPAQDAAATVADNYATCHETAERLTSLQEWVRGQAKIQ